MLRLRLWKLLVAGVGGSRRVRNAGGGVREPGTGRESMEKFGPFCHPWCLLLPGSDVLWWRPYGRAALVGHVKWCGPVAGCGNDIARLGTIGRRRLGQRVPRSRPMSCEARLQTTGQAALSRCLRSQVSVSAMRRFGLVRRLAEYGFSNSSVACAGIPRPPRHHPAACPFCAKQAWETRMVGRERHAGAEGLCRCGEGAGQGGAESAGAATRQEGCFAPRGQPSRARR